MYVQRARSKRISGLGFCPNPATLLIAIFLCGVLAFGSGCYFSEKSFPIDIRRTVRADTTGNLPARQWLVQVHKQIKGLLPHHPKPVLLTDELSDSSGRPIDLVARYSIKPDKLESIFVNWMGLSYSAQVTGADAGNTPAPPWPGFIDVWVPINPDFKLAGRLGMARGADGKVLSADCIVLLPGLCGGNNVIRQRDLAMSLKSSGMHVLSVETRGQGQTAVRYPDVACTWGLMESYDLLMVSDWLESKENVRRTGMIGFSWGGVHAMLTAWSNGRADTHPSVAPELARLVPKLPPKLRYRAGILVFSPVLDVDVLADKLSTPQSFLVRPFRAGLQKTVRNWKRLRGFPNPTGALADVVRSKRLQHDGARQQHRGFIRLLPYKDKPAYPKLPAVGSPMLIVHAANDPIAPVQTVADLYAGVKNPNVAAIVLPTGGHIGFASFAKDWYYSMILSFFDPDKGPKPAPLDRGPDVK